MAASESVADGTTQLLHAMEALSPDKIAVIAYFLSVQAESLPQTLFRPFMDRAVVMLDILGSCSAEAASHLRGESWSKHLFASVLVVTRKLVDVAHKMGTARAVILPIMRVVESFCTAPNTLTTFHSVIMEVTYKLIIYKVIC